MTDDYKQLTLPDFIEIKQRKERTISFSVPFKDRLEIYDAYAYARDVLKTPFNSVVQFAFERNTNDSTKDILRIRRVCHYIRMHFQHKNQDCIMIWSRLSPPGSGMEHCHIMIHLKTDEDAKAFARKIKKWTFEDLSLLGFDDSHCSVENGRQVTVLDGMMQNCDKWTEYRIKGVYSNPNDPMVGPVAFTSLKLHRDKLRPHKARQMMETLGKLNLSAPRPVDQSERNYSEEFSPEYK